MDEKKQIKRLQEENQRLRDAVDLHRNKANALAYMDELTTKQAKIEVLREVRDQRIRELENDHGWNTPREYREIIRDKLKQLENGQFPQNADSPNRENREV